MIVTSLIILVIFAFGRLFDDGESGQNLVGKSTGYAMPFGSVDAATCSSVGGWAKDPDWSGPLRILVYADGVSAQNLVAIGEAQHHRSDLCNYPHIGCNQAYNIVFTDAQKALLGNGNQRTLYIYAAGKNLGGAEDGINTLLATRTIGPCATQSPPFGSLDLANCNTIGGWARDPDWSQGISIHYYLDGPAGQGQVLAGSTANSYRSDLCAYTHIGCNSAFGYSLTNSDKERIQDGNTHQIYAYALGKNSQGINDGMNILLPGSPKTVGPCANPNQNPAYTPLKTTPVTQAELQLETITNGRVTIGVSKRFGGAIAYLADSTIGNENMVDNSNGGTLLTTAIWLWPQDTGQLNMCYESQKVNGVCPGTIHYKNPTLGGFLGYGWAGNPNMPTVSRSGNTRIETSSRMVNYNFAYHAHLRGNDPRSPLPTYSNREEWQTNVWTDQKITFHPTYSNVIIVETNISYCKNMEPGCAHLNYVHAFNSQGIQVNTFFARGQNHPDPNYRGPFTRTQVYENYDLSNGNDCNKAALVLRSDRDVGAGIYLDRFYTGLMFNYGTAGSCRYLLDPWPSIHANNPHLWGFEYHKVGIHNYGFTMDAGGWFKFKTYIVTGTRDEITSTLLRVSQE